jgi:nitrogen fixation NifU-like protein
MVGKADEIEAIPGDFDPGVFDVAVEEAVFKTFGCGSAIAASSLATEWIKGKTVEQAKEIRNTTIAKSLALPPVKLHCSMLAEDAIAAAVSDYQAKQQGGLSQSTDAP